MKKRNLLLSLSYLLMTTAPAFAFQMKGEIKLKGQSGSSGPRVKSSSGSSIGASVSPNVSSECEIKDTRKSDYLSLGLVKELMASPEQFKVEKVGKNTHKISIPNLINNAGCLNNLKIETVGVDNGVGIVFKLENDGSEYHGYNQIKNCFDKNGLMKGEDFVGSVTDEDVKTFAFEVTLDEFDQSSLDTKKLVFISPDKDPANKERAFPSKDAKIIDPAFNRCYAAESHNEDGYKIYVNQSKAELEAACSSNDVRAMLRAYNNLDPALFGNTLSVFNQLKKALEINISQQINKNNKNILAKLEKFRTDKLRDAAKAMDKDELEEYEARDVLNEYKKLLQEYDEEVLDPARAELRKIVGEYDSASDARKGEIDKRVRQLKDIIGSLSKYEKKYGSQEATDIAKKFALTDSGRDIVGFTLKSGYMSKMGTSNRSLPYEDAKKEIDIKMREFDRMAQRWERDYEEYSDAREGDSRPARRASNYAAMYERAQKQSLQRFQQNEAKLRESCRPGMLGFAQNAGRCKRVMDPRAVHARLNDYYSERDHLGQAASYHNRRAEYYGYLNWQYRQNEMRDYYDEYDLLDPYDPYSDRRSSYDPYSLSGRYGESFGSQMRIPTDYSVPYSGDVLYNNFNIGNGSRMPASGGQGFNPYYSQPEYPMIPYRR